MPIAPPPVAAYAIAGPKALAGTWRTACLPIGRDGRHGALTTIAIAGKNLTLVSQVYARPDCLAPTFRITYRGRIAGAQMAGDRIVFRHDTRATTLMPQDPSVVAQYSLKDGRRHGCGLTGWRLNVEMSVAGQTCDPLTLAPNGVTLFDAAWIGSDGTLRFGALPALWSNTSESLRPTVPLPIVYSRAVP